MCKESQIDVMSPNNRAHRRKLGTDFCSRGCHGNDVDNSASY